MFRPSITPAEAIAAHLNSPIEITINLTQRCNLSCVHCYMRGGEWGIEDIDFSLLSKLNDEIGDKLFFVYLAGGEPLLYPRLMDALHLFKERDIYTSVSTNGVLLTYDLAVALRDAGLDHFQISLEGATEATNDAIRGDGTYSKIIEGIKSAAHSGVSTVVATTITALNAHEIIEIAKLTEDCGARILHFGFNQPAGRGAQLAKHADIFEHKDILKKFLDDIEHIKEHCDVSLSVSGNRFLFFPLTNEQKGRVLSNITTTDLCYINCEAGKTKCILDADGTIYPCELTLAPEFQYGTIKERRFLDIWDTEFQHFRTRVYTDIPDCAGCDLILACQGGCPAASYLKYKTFLRKDPRCKYDFESLGHTDALKSKPLLYVNPSVNGRDIFLAKPGLKKRQEDFGYLLLDPETLKISELNELGLAVIFLCDGQRTVEDIEKSVTSTYESVSADEISHDVREFLEAALRIGIVRIAQ